MHDILGESYAELAQLYLTEAPVKVKQLTDALAQGNIETTHSLAHHLKGSALSLGATDLAELLAVLESAGKAGDLTTLDLHGSKLASVFAQTEQAMNHFLQDEISTTVR
jgi:HPt (histidine-containing phosphotransfer) domain-containing protein